jgi:F-type H+-transporting ATPase subunit alpha
MDVEKQVLIIWAATSGKLDDIPVDQARRFEADFVRFVETSHPATLSALREKKALTDEIKGGSNRSSTTSRRLGRSARSTRSPTRPQTRRRPRRRVPGPGA